MNFHEIMQQLLAIKETIENSENLLLCIEKDILKKELSDIYLNLSNRSETQPEAPVAPKENRIRQEEKDPTPENVIFYTEKPEPVSFEITTQQPEIITEKPVKKPIDYDYKTLADVFLDRKTVGDKQEDNSVLSKMAHSKIYDLKRAIAMHDRFIFIKELFNSDFESYNNSIEAINKYSDIEEARQHLMILKGRYSWNSDNDVVKYFISLIERKFL